MERVLPLDRMSTDEKLRALEEIWADLSRVPDSVPAPQWHQDALEARERRIEEGAATFDEWTVAKQRLRERTR